MDEPNELYDNLLVQSRINRIGQTLVPKDSERMFAFRLTADPTPAAMTLSTGTIYVSTGMVSLLDNEAQLAYVLAHEMAHVQLDHWKQKVMMERGLEAYNAEQAKKAERIAGIAAIGGGIAGGVFSRSVAGTIGSAIAGGGLGLVAGNLLNRRTVVNWDRAQEDEADKMAFKYMLVSKYDVREVPKLYSLMENVVTKDSRVALGFLGERNRIKERKDSADKLINDAYKAEIEAQLKGDGFGGDSAGHRNLMAELKRDNGIMAYYTDMFQMARKNLEEAVAIRDNDPAAQYYYGKVLETIGRTPEDRKMAEQAFAKAEQYDSKQQENYNFGAHLHRALMMIDDNKSDQQSQLTSELNDYVKAYVEFNVKHQKALYIPPNVNTIGEYMALYGMTDWHPQMPEGAENLRANPNELPQAPSTKTPPKVSAPPIQPTAGKCPAGTQLIPGPAGSIANAICQAAAPVKK
jgi:predicted Zn-dependent protease